MFEIPDVKDFVAPRLKPWIFIFFVLIVQFSGGLYLAAASDMVGTTGLMQEDILMAGYASLIGLAINFAVMFRIKFRFSTYLQLLVCGAVLIISLIICSVTGSVAVLVTTCLIAGFFRMQATFACNSTIQLWLTPTRDMSVFFCYVYLIVESVIQLSGIAAIYSAFHLDWQLMHLIMIGALALMMLLVLTIFRPVRPHMFIPLLGIDWLGGALWTAVMMAFTFVCVYGDFYDWFESREICVASLIGLACLAINLVRAGYLRRPYISWPAMTNRRVVIAVVINLIFFTLLGTEHVIEHSYAASILGFDETNLIDLNWYVFFGILAGCAFTYVTFARRKWGYLPMSIIGFAFLAAYLAWFYFNIDFNLEKQQLALPLFMRGFASVSISIVFLTSIVRSGLPFMVFPQALVVNGFTGAVMGATLGPAIIGELLRHVMAKNLTMLTAGLPDMSLIDAAQAQALIVSCKEIYGLLLIAALLFLVILTVRGAQRFVK